MKEGYKEEQCLDAIRRHFMEYNSKTIKEVTKGVFEGSEDDWNAFGSTARFSYTKRFLKVIKEWYWDLDEGDGMGVQKEDYLKSYYEVKVANT